jgi:ribosomal protein L25 (general stress protein Ctc)
MNYVNKNEDIKDTLHQISIELRELESTIFDIKVKQKKNVVPMKECIENWLKQAIIKITEEYQLEEFCTGQPTATIYYTKETSTRN